MMKITELLERKKPIFSFEFFPPKTEEGEKRLFETIENLKELKPAFVSVTYGAGGSTRDKTVDWVIKIKRDLQIEAMAHITCIGTSMEMLKNILEVLRKNDIENILALRGDKPKETDKPYPQCFDHASQLIEFIKKHYDFCVGAAAFPEGHIETSSLEEDTYYMKIKADSGADFFITQLFFDNKFYFDLVERASRAGITRPIIPGIMPITSVDQIKRFTTMCGASIPDKLKKRLDTLRDYPEKVIEFGIRYATEQCKELLSRGVPGIHFYTLNRSSATRKILENLLTQSRIHL